MKKLYLSFVIILFVGCTSSISSVDESLINQDQKIIEVVRNAQDVGDIDRTHPSVWNAPADSAQSDTTGTNSYNGGNGKDHWPIGSSHSGGYDPTS